MNIIKWYSETKFHQWWVDHVWKPSWTKFISFWAGLPAAVVAGAQGVAAMAHDSNVQSYLAQMNVPQYVPAAIAAVALVYYIASGRD